MHAPIVLRSTAAVYAAVEREDDRRTATAARAATRCYASVSIDMQCEGVQTARLDLMNTRADIILDEALALPADERSAVAVALLDSLENANPDSVSEAWRAEVKRRRDEFHAGNVRATPWTDVKQRYRAL